MLAMYALRAILNRQPWSMLALLVGLTTTTLPVVAAVDEDALKLHQAWSELLGDLNDAEQTLLLEEHFPPAPNERVLADGYRYMLAHLNREIEELTMRADPRFPEFFRSVDMLRKWTAENPDAMYLNARIDASGYYEVTISARNTEEWRDDTAQVAGEKAPRLVTFQTITAVPGYTGELQEMATCVSQTLDFTNSFTLQADKAGEYKILIGAEKPKGFNGNFLSSRKELKCQATGVTAMADASLLSVREIFSDWENEVPLDMTITRLDAVGANRRPLNVDQMAQVIETLGKNVRNQMRFWNLLMEFPLGMTQDRNGDGRRQLPVNGINQPAVPFTAAGVAGARQLYASGIFDLAEDEALVIKMTTPVEPYYVGFQLSDLWMQGPDQQNFVSSLSGAQNQPAGDATRYYIIAATDPGVQGWVDTTGLRLGSHAMRFVFEEDPTEAQLPVLEATLVKLDQLGDMLPENYPLVSEVERRQQIAIRQEHIKRRWRNY